MLELWQDWTHTEGVPWTQENFYHHQAVKLQRGSSVGHWVTSIKPGGNNITVPITLEGKEALMLVDTGASRSCLSETFYNQHQRQLGGLHSTSPIQGADGTELALAGETGRLRLQWRGCALQISLIVVRGLAGVDGILGMDVLKPLGVKIWTHANLAEPGGSITSDEKILCLSDHLDLPPHSWRQIHLHHDLPSSTTMFSPTTKLPPGLRAAPTVSKGESVVVTIAN